jgi:hypothetical protein
MRLPGRGCAVFFLDIILKRLTDIVLLNAKVFGLFHLNHGFLLGDGWTLGGRRFDRAVCGISKFLDILDGFETIVSIAVRRCFVLTVPHFYGTFFSDEKSSRGLELRNVTC